MKLPPDPPYRHLLPAEIVGHAIWLCRMFSLSLSGVDVHLAKRGIVVSYETYGAGTRNSVRRLPAACATADNGPERSGISMRSSSESKACSTISGTRRIRTAS